MTDNGEGKVLLGLVKHIKTDRMLDFLIQLSSGFLLNMATGTYIACQLTGSLGYLVSRCDHSGKTAFSSRSSAVFCVSHLGSSKDTSECPTTVPLDI